MTISPSYSGRTLFPHEVVGTLSILQIFKIRWQGVVVQYILTDSRWTEIFIIKCIINRIINLYPGVHSRHKSYMVNRVNKHSLDVSHICLVNRNASSRISSLILPPRQSIISFTLISSSSSSIPYLTSKAVRCCHSTRIIQSSTSVTMLIIVDLIYKSLQPDSRRRGVANQGVVPSKYSKIPHKSASRPQSTFCSPPFHVPFSSG